MSLTSMDPHGRIASPSGTPSTTAATALKPAPKTLRPLWIGAGAVVIVLAEVLVLVALLG